MKFGIIYSAKSIRKQEKIFNMLLNIKPVLRITIYTNTIFRLQVIFDLVHFKVQPRKNYMNLNCLIFSQKLFNSLCIRICIFT